MGGCFSNEEKEKSILGVVFKGAYTLLFLRA
jgi:hypothetical protein